MFKVLKEFKGSPDGYTVIAYAAGAEVNLAPDLAKVALKEKWVKELPAKPKPDPEAERCAAEVKAIAEARERDEKLAGLNQAIADLEATIANAPEADLAALNAQLAETIAARDALSADVSTDTAPV